MQNDILIRIMQKHGHVRADVMAFFLVHSDAPFQFMDFVRVVGNIATAHRFLRKLVDSGELERVRVESQFRAGQVNGYRVAERFWEVKE